MNFPKASTKRAGLVNWKVPGRLQANTFPKTDLDLNNPEGASDVVPGSQNKIENNFLGASVPESP